MGECSEIFSSDYRMRDTEERKRPVGKRKSKTRYRRERMDGEHDCGSPALTCAIFSSLQRWDEIPDKLEWTRARKGKALVFPSGPPLPPPPPFPPPPPRPSEPQSSRRIFILSISPNWLIVVVARNRPPSTFIVCLKGHFPSDEKKADARRLPPAVPPFLHA